MADAEYIEITNNDVADVKKESGMLGAEEHSQSTEVKSEQQLEQSSESEVANEDKTNEPSATLLKGVKDNDGSLDVAADKHVKSNKFPEGDVAAELPDLTTESDAPDTTSMPTEMESADHGDLDINKSINAAEATDTQDTSEAFEVIEEQPTSPTSDEKKEREEMVVSEGNTEDKSSPFRRFRSFTKPERKESTGSSINIPSIFSTPFMSLKNIGKRKESPADEQQPMAGDHTPSPGSAGAVEHLRIERKNLLGMAKLSIKGLIESSLSAGHTLDSDHAPLEQFFVIMEAVLKHGLKGPKLFFAGNKQFWGPLEAIEKIASDASEITNSVRELPGIKTHAGRARAWLRLALMQKRLADYFKIMVESKSIMSEFYEYEALVLSEEGIVLSGHLVGLNCIDANLCMKGDDLDNQNAVIDYSLYIKDGNRSIHAEPDHFTEQDGENEEKQGESETVEEKMRELVNQKNYLEERNRYLETTLSELQKKAGHTSSSNQFLEAELQAAKISLGSLKEEKEKWLEEKQDISDTHKKILRDKQADLDLERETLVQSRAGLDEMLNQVKKQLKQEAILRMDVEKELELQISLKQEMEVAMKLLEKDIYDKQDSLVILREQLESVKVLNIEIYKKLQDKTDAVESKTRAITELEDETKRLDMELTKLKEKNVEANRQLYAALEKADRALQNLDDSEKRRGTLDTNLKIEREWRMALEKKDEKSAMQISQLEAELSMMKLLKQELEEVKNDRDELRNTCEEQESTINDLADHLGKSKQNFQDLKDVHRSITDKTWEKDKEVKNCTQCQKPFSVARRKHHCRNCGQIFCNTCSDNTMPLASSAKPVRVCDACQTTLLERYNAAST